MYHTAAKAGEGLEEVDLRSDTVTKPSAEMRQAMANAEVGDDVFRDDPTVLELEARVAALAGKEAALFVPSGTMGNLICVLSHCNSRGQEILLGDLSHIHYYEQGGVATLGGVHPRTLKTREDGTFCLQELKDKVRDDDPHLPVTSLVAIENTHNKCGGRVLPLSWLEELGATCRQLGLPLHCDGARIFHAVEHLGVSLKKLLEQCDSASICLSKGLGCPVGSVIVGTKTLMARALRVRKALGGGLRQAGILAAAGIFALDNQVARLSEDHKHARMIAQAVSNVGRGRLSLRQVDTNIVIVGVDPTLATPGQVVAALAKAGILGMEVTRTEFRLTLHCGITTSLAILAADRLETTLSALLFPSE